MLELNKCRAQVFSCQIVTNTCCFLAAGTLEDAHLLEVAQRITDKSELRHLGLNILKVPANKVDSTLTNERDIQDAAYTVLQTWYHNQQSRQDAYKSLYRELVNNGRQLWANELKQSVTGTVDSEPLSEHRTYYVKRQTHTCGQTNMSRNFNLLFHQLVISVFTFISINFFPFMFLQNIISYELV